MAEVDQDAEARLCLPVMCTVIKHTSVVPYPQVTWSYIVQGVGLGDSGGLGQFGVSVWDAPGKWLLREAAWMPANC